MRNQDFTSIIKLATNIIAQGSNVLLIGDRGIGKSESMAMILNDLTKSEEYPNGDERRWVIQNLNQVRDPSLLFLPVLDSRPVLDEHFNPMFEDAVRMVEQGAQLSDVAERLPKMEKYLRLESLADLDRDYVGFDEITDAGEGIHSFLLSVLLDKRVGGKKLRTKGYLLAGTPPESSSASTGLSRPFLERAAVLRLPAPNQDEWLEYMIGQMPAWYAQFIRKVGSTVLYVKEEEGSSDDYVQKPSPRQHSQAARILRRLGVAHTHDDAFNVIEAYAGPMVAQQFAAFISQNLEMYTFNEWQRTKKMPDTFIKLMYLVDDFVATVPEADQRILEHTDLVDKLVSTLVQFPKLYKMPVPHTLMHGYVVKGMTAAGNERYIDLLQKNKDMQAYRANYASRPR